MPRPKALNLSAATFIFGIVITCASQDLDSSDAGWYINENGLPEEFDDYYDDYWDYDSSMERRGQVRDFMPPIQPMMMMPSKKSGCFPGAAKVTLDNGDTINVAHLKEGQKVLTATDDGELLYSEVVVFLKRIRRMLAPYRVLETSSAAVSLSDTHVIFVSSGNATTDLSTKFAKDVKIGDWILVKSGGTLKPEAVIHAHRIYMEGVYVPLTEHGTIVVDGILASCYASFNHWLANFFLAPIRLWPSFFGCTRMEHDMPAYVYALKEIGHFLLPSRYQDRTHWAATLLFAS